MTPLTLDEFRDALRKGQGRAVLHVREHGAGTYLDEIRHACVHNLAYDAQCEGSRADWLMSLIDLSGQDAYFLDAMLAALAHATRIWDVDQILRLATLFALRGSDRARAVIYETFNMTSASTF